MKEARCAQITEEVGKIVVPYSGGIDSSYLIARGYLGVIIMSSQQ